MKRRSFLTIILTCVLSSTVTAAAVIALLITRAGGVDAFFDAMKYAAIRKIITDSYIGDADMDSVNDKGYAGMISALDDRWSYYLSADEYAYYLSYSRNSYTGIGVSIETDSDTGEQHIVSVTEGSPAHEAGVTAGQVMLQLDGIELSGLTASDVRVMIQATEGADFTLTIKNPDGSLIDVRLKCGSVFTDPVSFEMLEDGVGYVRIRNFEYGCAESFHSAVETLTNDGAEAFIFDVRSNPGGRVSELMPILDLLLPEGDIFVMCGKDGSETVNKSDSQCIEVPMAVLVNSDSYSAAEFFAAALQEYGWACVAGEATTGKGRAQVTFELSDGSAVHISTSVYLTPNRRDLSAEGGIIPDEPVEISAEKRGLFNSGRLDYSEDSQLLRALEILR